MRVTSVSLRKSEVGPSSPGSGAGSGGPISASSRSAAASGADTSRACTKIIGASRPRTPTGNTLIDAVGASAPSASRVSAKATSAMDSRPASAQRASRAMASPAGAPRSSNRRSGARLGSPISAITAAFATTRRIFSSSKKVGAAARSTACVSSSKVGSVCGSPSLARAISAATVISFSAMAAISSSISRVRREGQVSALRALTSATVSATTNGSRSDRTGARSPARNLGASRTKVCAAR